MKPQFYYSVNIFVPTLEMDLVREIGLNRNMFLERVSSLETHLEILVIILLNDNSNISTIQTLF